MDGRSTRADLADNRHGTHIPQGGTQRYAEPHPCLDIDRVDELRSNRTLRYVF